MQTIPGVLLTLFPIAAVVLELWLAAWALTDLSHRQVEQRMMWMFVIIFFPVFGALYYFLTFRRNS